MIRQILVWPHEGLRKVCEPFKAFGTDEARALERDLFDTMNAMRGLGLAAPQIGETVRVIVVDTRPVDPRGQAIALFNPRIVHSSEDTTVFIEGCLSLPGARVEVRRSSTVKVVYQDADGKEHEIEGDGILADALQHEIDHLDGKVMLDRVGPVQRNLALTKVRKFVRTLKRNTIQS